MAKRSRFAAARKVAGHSQESLAELVGVERSTVVRWEAGDTTPQPWLRPKLAHALRVSAAQLAELLIGEVAARYPNAASDAPAGAAAAEEVRHTLHDLIERGAPSETSLDDWELVVARYGAASRDRPAGRLLDDLTRDFADLQSVMERCRSAHALRRLTRVAANLSGLMCLTLIKLDDRAGFRRWSRTARLVASEVDDPVTYSWVLAQEAYGHFYGDDLLEAIQVAQHAQAVSGLPSVGAVLAAALEARAHGVRGDAAGTHAALRIAERLLLALDDADKATSAFAYNEAQLRFHESNALTSLGDTGAAWQAQDRALQLIPAADFMDRAFTQLDRAVCMAAEGDARGAATQALSALTQLSDEQRQGIIVGRARQLVAGLPEQRQVSAPVRDLHDLLMIPTGKDS